MKVYLILCDFLFLVFMFSLHIDLLFAIAIPYTAIAF